VEIERARLTMTLAHIKEGQGNVAEAADILQELQVAYCPGPCSARGL
jgi:26S proteasome regulatory subunit N5